jgi:hypothetical protein
MYDLLSEFNRIIEKLRDTPIRYAVVGGLAVAIHGAPRATEDVDFLVHHTDIEQFCSLLKSLSYVTTTKPWTFANTQLTLHRYFRGERGRDELYVVDLLSASDPAHLAMLSRTKEAPWAGGVLRVLSRKDLIIMKRARNSNQDLADIERMERPDDPENKS